MTGTSINGIARDGIAEIERLHARIEGSFATVGGSLGRGHALFEHLKDGLSQLATDLSGTDMAEAATAFHEIADSLTRLASGLAHENGLLSAIGARSNAAAGLLRLLLKHVQMITIIARSARIEAASLEGERESFLNFTQEAYTLARTVQSSIEACVRDQARLSSAVGLALERQHAFEVGYGAQLTSIGAEMGGAHRGLQEHQSGAVRLAEGTGAVASRIAGAVGLAIVSLQAGDSMRQRLEHICSGLRTIPADAAPLAPGNEDAALADLVGRLEADQLHDASTSFEADIRQIAGALAALKADVAGIDEQGGGLFGGDKSSFLAALEANLSQASELIASCERARRTVDDALAVVEDTLAKFRGAVEELSQTVIDIILIGMNAGLRAGHLGAKGSAFVVIANELKATADQISHGTRQLQPVLDAVAASANELAAVRAAAGSAQLANLEPTILRTIGELRGGNERLGQVMRSLGEESAEFEALVSAAESELAGLATHAAALPVLAGRLRTASDLVRVTPEAAARLAPDLDRLQAQYTMAAEREVHRALLQQIGLATAAAPPAATSDADTDDVLFF